MKPIFRSCIDMSDAELRAHLLRIGAMVIAGGFLFGGVAGYQLAHLLAMAPR
ncbi:hypothetical protein [Methylocystis sp.]|uniref:hypothetical protein n=1 Tax=Methylocystis sp. TaxID=1911079 RepID=UPI0027353D06|nr:hypothetical protein [Methylocystis sp.]MDP3554856.1 hypothetical protein [Methylocystis sp.]